jgi:acyl-CoA thioesterase
MIIYKVENLINGKTYIGRTVTSLENRRWLKRAQIERRTRERLNVNR